MSNGQQPDNPLFALLHMASGLWLSRALWTAAHLKVADAIGDEPVPVGRLAAQTGTDPTNLKRLMNALVAAGVFAAAGDDAFAHGPLSPFLKSDHPLSQRAFIDGIFGGEHFTSWGTISESVKTGTTGFDSVYGMPVFDWYSGHEEEAQRFSRAMEGTTRIIEAALLACWTPPPFELAVDVGGSRGTLVASLLAGAPGARGILFDLPDIVEAVGGDFFRNVPEGDLYLLKLILHDWTDEQASAILRNIRAAIRPGGRVAIIENLLPDEIEPHPGYLMDLNMMVMTGGRERKAAEFAALLEQTGFKLEGVTPTPTPIGVVQGVAV
jgi:hypothetical protein